MAITKIYLAGPDLYHEDSEDIDSKNREIVREAGFAAFNILDCPDIDELYAFKFATEQAEFIFKEKRKLMDRCHAVVANVSNVFGPFPDQDTLFELAYMVGQGKPCIIYSDNNKPFDERLEASSVELKEEYEDYHSFGLINNIMLQCGVEKVMHKSLYRAMVYAKQLWKDNTPETMRYVK